MNKLNITHQEAGVEAEACNLIRRKINSLVHVHKNLENKFIRELGLEPGEYQYILGAYSYSKVEPDMFEKLSYIYLELINFIVREKSGYVDDR
jgi:hypothetical protein